MNNELSLNQFSNRVLNVLLFQVAEARKRKARRLKQAKDEAQADIEKYRADKDQAFKVIPNNILEILIDANSTSPIGFLLVESAIAYVVGYISRLLVQLRDKVSEQYISFITKNEHFECFFLIHRPMRRRIKDHGITSRSELKQTHNDRFSK